MDYVKLPIKPTKELLELIAVQKWPEDWDNGKQVQKELGLEIVPPNSEMEMAAGVYVKIVNFLLNAS